MKLTIDTNTRTLTADGEELPLYGSKAFALLSREWVKIGWSLRYYHTFQWFGRSILQLPEDLIRLQEAIYTIRPDLIIETGINEGGSLLFHASLCEAMGKGRVIGIDLAIPPETKAVLAAHDLAKRIRTIEGDSAGENTIETVRNAIQPNETVMVILDSDHSAAHVRRELEAFAPLVTPGSCIIATDGVMHDLADVPNGLPGWIDDNPSTAAREFLQAHPEFELRQPASATTYWPEAWLFKTRLG